MQQKTRNLQETTVAYGLWGLFPSIIGGTPPGKRGPRNLHGTHPSNLKKWDKKLEICKKPLRPMAYEVSFPSIIGGTPLSKRGPHNFDGNPHSNLKNAAKYSKCARNYWGQFVMRSLSHLLLGETPLVNGGLEICMDLPFQPQKMRQKSRNWQKTTEANGLCGLFSIYYLGDPP